MADRSIPPPYAKKKKPDASGMFGFLDPQKICVLLYTVVIITLLMEFFSKTEIILMVGILDLIKIYLIILPTWVGKFGWFTLLFDARTFLIGLQ